jgi:RND family efflux transporter MFP subunit
MKKRFLYIIPALILIVGFLLMMWFFSMKEVPTRKSLEPIPKLVETEVVRLSNIPTTITSFGRISSAQPIALYSEVGGTIMRGDLAFQAAQSFKKGQLLLKIDDRRTRYELNSRISEFLKALAGFLAEVKTTFPDEYDRWQQYFDNIEFEKRLSPLPETEDKRMKLYLARFNIYQLYYAILNLEVTLEKHFIYAPFDGSIAEVVLYEGSNVKSGSLLGKIINMENLEVEVPVALADLQWIDYRGKVIVNSSAVPGSFNGSLVRIGSTIDERTQTVPVFVGLKNYRDINLLDGLFMEAEIPGIEIDSAFSIPRRALYGERYVYLIKEGVLEYRQVAIARRENDRIIINGGLHDGDTLVTEILQGAGPGMPAKARMAASEDRGE